MRRERWLTAGAVGMLGLAGTLFALSLTGDVPGLMGLAALAAVPVCGVGLSLGATGRGSRGS